MLTIDSDILTIEPDVILFSFEDITVFTFTSLSFSLFFYLFILTDGQDRLRVYDGEQLNQIKQGNK